VRFSGTLLGLVRVDNGLGTRLEVARKYIVGATLLEGSLGGDEGAIEGGEDGAADFEDGGEGSLEGIADFEGGGEGATEGASEGAGDGTIDFEGGDEGATEGASEGAGDDTTDFEGDGEKEEADVGDSDCLGVGSCERLGIDCFGELLGGTDPVALLGHTGTPCPHPGDPNTQHGREEALT